MEELKVNKENTRVAVITIIVEDKNKSSLINDILHNYADFIIGRMGIPYAPKEISIISIAVDASQDKISALSGKLGAIEGVSTKTMYSAK